MTTSVYNVTCSTAPGASRADLATESSVGRPRLTARGQTSPGIRGALHPRWTARYRHSPLMVRALPALLVGASLSGCTMELPFELDPDVVALSLLLEPGERSAKMAASYPHRMWDEGPPDISASLEGPGWTVEFTGTGEWECGSLPSYGACTWLSAQLPEVVAPGRYRVRGTTPRGSFSGEATVPGMPSIENPAGDTLWIHLPDDTAGFVLVPLEYQVDSATAALFLESTFERNGERVRGRVLWELGDSIDLRYEEGEISLRGLRLRLQALGPSYTSWLRHVGPALEPPWPPAGLPRGVELFEARSFGIEGEGAYGYFDGVSAPTRWVDVAVASDP